MEILRFIHNQKLTRETLIPLVLGHVTTRAKGARKPYSLIIIEKKNVDIRVARIFNTYGPRMLPDDGRVVSNFIVQAIKGEDLTIYGDGKQTRSFCYVDELIDGLIKLMNHPDCIGPVNIGNPGEFTILELADTIIQKTNNSSRISMYPLPGDDPLQENLTFLSPRNS